MNSAWIVIFVSYTVNPCEVTVHAQEKKKEVKVWKRAAGFVTIQTVTLYTHVKD